MKVLFVSSGNSVFGVSPIVQRQGLSLENEGIEIIYFRIQGKGLKGYLTNILPLNKFIRNTQPDLIHAHYSLSGFMAPLAGASPLIVSLMGSDVKSSKPFKWLVLFFSHFFWKKTIVKSEDMKISLGIKKVEIIPNGINLAVFKYIEKNNARQKLNWNNTKKHILFAANPKRPEKNFKLTQNAVNLLNENIELHTLTDIKPENVPEFMNAADVIVLSSLWEGSPNVIKEAMACSKPIVATNVGDIQWLFGYEPGHFISSFDACDMAEKIHNALLFSKQNERTKGRDRIMKLGLDAESVAKRIIKTYHEILKTDG